MRVDDLKNTMRVLSDKVTRIEKAEGFLITPDFNAKDTKLDEKTVTHPGLRELMRSMGGRIKPKLNNLRTKMAVGSSISSASGGALSTVINVRPSALSEFASFQALFDEFKVHGGVLHFNTFLVGAGTAAIVGLDDVAIAYDPVDNSAFATVAGVLVSSQHIGPLNTSGVSDASATSASVVRTIAPVPHTKHGFWQFPFRCPKSPQFVPNNSQQVMTGEWSATNISNTQSDYGYLKPYVAGAGSTTSTLNYYLVMDVEFRSRT